MLAQAEFRFVQTTIRFQRQVIKIIYHYLSRRWRTKKNEASKFLSTSKSSSLFPQKSLKGNQFYYYHIIFNIVYPLRWQIPKSLLCAIAIIHISRNVVVPACSRVDNIIISINFIFRAYSQVDPKLLVLSVIKVYFMFFSRCFFSCAESHVSLTCLGNSL